MPFSPPPCESPVPVFSIPFNTTASSFETRINWSIPEDLKDLNSTGSLNPAFTGNETVLPSNFGTENDPLSARTFQINEYFVNYPTQDKKIRGQKLYHYIHHAIRDNYLSKETAEIVIDILSRIVEISQGKVTIPDASVVENDGFYFIWDLQEHHLEIEINSIGECYFFYRNRTSGDCWDSEYKHGDEFREDVVSKLELFYIQ